MKNLLFLASLAAFLILAIVALNTFPNLIKSVPPFSEPAKVANAAVKYCLAQGGTRLVKTDTAGNVFGFCRFSGGALCEEWAFYQGTCQKP